MKTNTMDRTSAAGALAETVGHFVAEIGRFFAAMAAGAQASRDYERLSRSSDPALKREGLTRESIARTVMERHFR